MRRSDQPLTGLILSGGGARAAYQVGVLAAIAELLPNAACNPFPVIVGTSAGAINAVGLASGALHFQQSVARLKAVWQQFQCEHVYRADWPGVLRQAGRFVGRSVLGVGAPVPVALLNNHPLRELLEKELDTSGITAAIRARHLQAVGVTAFGYETGQAVTFYQGRGCIDPWLRHRRIGIPTRLDVEHLMASAAIPLVFAPVKINREYFGDGALRQSAPISPALHLGASRVLVIGVSGPQQTSGFSALEGLPTGLPPSLAQISGHMLNSTFVDNLETDIELLERMNMMSHVLPAHPLPRTVGVKPVEVLVIQPSQPLEAIAARHRRALPLALRTFLRGSGATRNNGAGVLSYLLFEPGYCQELIALGYQDAMQRKVALTAFLGVGAAPVSAHQTGA